MTTLLEAHGGPDASYYGDSPGWEIVLTKTRDASVLDRANWDAAMSRLKLYGDENDYAVETSGHWAVGHIDFLIVRPTHNPDDITSYDIALEIRVELDAYPVLDDELLSQYEHDALNEFWQGIGADERIQYLKENCDSIFAARAVDAWALYNRAEATYYDLQSSVTE